ncbi:MAG: histidine triad nucleotide-binding protein [Chloroflexi bacterium]|nr:histidine triad nucleotide-binding protein [Chloroflexota bacterium]
MPTIFSKIVAGEIPADIVYQDERVTAFKDIHPLAPVHILIIPNKEIATVDDVSPEDEATLGHLFVVAKEVARKLGIAESGYRLIINCKGDGGQEVFHLHLHLLGGKKLGSMLAKS